MARDRDIVLFGATGFTGGLTAAELAQRAPSGAKIALAGRSLEKLELVRERLAAAAPRLADAELVVADASDRAALRDLAASTRVLASTAGPFVLHGGEVVAACAAEGTAYADITGEPEFVDRTYLDCQDAALASGARLVHCCGFDSIPHDLGAQFTVGQFGGDVPLHVRGYVRTEGGTFSGGTFNSVLLAFGRARQMALAARRRVAAEKATTSGDGRLVRNETPRPHRALGYWAVPWPTIDPVIVTRSARALPEYGPQFTYGHYAAVRRLPTVIGGAAAAGGLFAAAQLPPLRDAIGRRVAPGTGPSVERMERSTFSVRFVAEGGGRRVVTEVSGGDPGYRETSRMLAESALCLAFDELPQLAGQLTTAQAMGSVLRERLERAGISFRVLNPA